MKCLVFILGFSSLILVVRGQDVVPNSRNPGASAIASEIAAQQQKPHKFNWWAAKRKLALRQNKGKQAFRNYHQELEQEQIAYHKRMIYQIKQARKLQRKHRQRRYSSPNHCYPSGKPRWKRKNFR